MTDTCDIDRLTTVWDEDEQKSVTTWASVHASVPCHVEEHPAPSRTLLTSELASPDVPLVKAPVTFVGIEPDDRVTLADGRVFWVTDAAPDDTTHPIELLVQCRRTR